MKEYFVEKTSVVILVFLLIINGGLFNTLVRAEPSNDPILVSQSNNEPLKYGVGERFYTSNDGLTVAFQGFDDSYSSIDQQIYVRNSKLNTTILVSRDINNMPVKNGSVTLSGISGDGKYLFYEARGSNVVSGLYRYSISTDENELEIADYSNGNSIAINYDGTVYTYVRVNSSGTQVLYIKNKKSNSDIKVAENAAVREDTLSNDGNTLIYELNGNYQGAGVATRKYDVATANSSPVIDSQNNYGSEALGLSGNGKIAVISSFDPALTSQSQPICEYIGCVYLKNLDSGNYKMVTKIINDQVDVSGYNISVSNDGSRYVVPSLSSPTGLVTVNTSTSQNYPVGYAANGTTPSRVSHLAKLTADGDEIIFTQSSEEFGSYKSCIDENGFRMQCTNLFKMKNLPRISIDNIAPVVTGILNTEPNSAGWYKTPVKITWLSEDNPQFSSGTPSVPSDTIAKLEGTHEYVSDQSCDPAGNCAAGRVRLSIDSVNPETIFTGLNTSIKILGQSITGVAMDASSGIDEVTLEFSGKYFSSKSGDILLDCNNDKTNCSWKFSTVHQNSYAGLITVRSTDVAGNSQSSSRYYTIL